MHEMIMDVHYAIFQKFWEFLPNALKIVQASTKHVCGSGVV